MAKTIKFNLILDENPVRNIEQLKENFSIEDMLSVYNNGLLHKWLNVRNYEDYLQKVKLINDKSDLDIIIELMKVFDIDYEEDKLNEISNIIDYIHKKNSDVRAAITTDFSDFSIKEYHEGYEKILNSILYDKDNLGKLKAIAEVLEEKYIELFKMNYDKIYKTLIEKSPLCILVMLSKEKLKKELLKINSLNKDLEEKILIKSTKNINKVNIDQIDMLGKYIHKKSVHGYDKWLTLENKDVIIVNSKRNTKFSAAYCPIVKIRENGSDYCYNEVYVRGKVLKGLNIKCENTELVIEYIVLDEIPKNSEAYKSIFGSIENKEKINKNLNKYIKSYSTKTEGHYKELEPRNKKLIIISVPKDSKVRAYGTTDSYSSEINGKYMILDGIEYLSNSNDSLVYMEV